LTKTEHFRTAAERSVGIDLAGLYDCARLTRDLGITRHAAEAIMRELPKQHLPGLRKNYVRGGDVQALLDEHVRAA